jgi:hypothetical protein
MSHPGHQARAHHTDHLAAAVQHRAARVARVQFRIELDLFEGVIISAQGTRDPRPLPPCLLSNSRCPTPQDHVRPIRPTTDVPRPFEPYMPSGIA